VLAGERNPYAVGAPFWAGFLSDFQDSKNLSLKIPVFLLSSDSLVHGSSGEDFGRFFGTIERDADREFILSAILADRFAAPIVTVGGACAMLLQTRRAGRGAL
jgi:hypothetical protein